MKKTLALVSILLLVYACDYERETSVELTQKEAQSRNELDDLIWSTMKTKGEFNWNLQSTQVVWSALQQSDQVLSVGFKPADYAGDLKETIHTIDIQENAWKNARKAVLDLILKEERKAKPSLNLEELIAFEEEILPVLDVRVTQLSTIEALRKSPLVRYAEPMGYEPALNTAKSSSGCGGYTEDFGLQLGSDYTNLSPNAKASWNHSFHNIAGAWTKTTGSGVKIMIIDTGISPNQDNLGSQFNQGSSSGRTVEKLATLREWQLFGTGPLESPNDDCGHGTAMSGVSTAPRGTDGNAAGIAYNAGLVGVRAASDVYLDASREVKGVSDAYTLAGNRSDIKITSMSLGRITSSSQMSDAIRYAYNKGKLIFCAGGTSFGFTAGFVGVIFPATMSEVVAVTGIKDNGSRCEACHDGSQIDFVVVMERASNGDHPITTAMSGNQPGTVGGSSVATAQTAGIAALVWSRFPSYTRDQVLNKLTTSGSFYPSKSGSFGWGVIDANLATN